jgi:hypothetical protein
MASKIQNFYVYFSASSEIRKDKNLLGLISEAIKKTGGKITLPWFEDNTVLTPEKLSAQAIKGIKKADIVIAEISSPSTGVGQQIALAMSWKIPVIAFRRSNSKSFPRFTLGYKSDLLTVVEYEGDNIEELIYKNLNVLLKSRFVKFNFISTLEINEYLNKKSASLNLSKSEVLRKIIKDWMAQERKTLTNEPRVNRKRPLPQI